MKMKKKKGNKLVFIIVLTLIISMFPMISINVRADAFGPTITINFAGNLSDLGGPYWRPSGESTALAGDWSNGYYTNGSRQHEDWIYINCTVYDSPDGVDKVQLRWYNDSVLIGMYNFSNLLGDYWEINTSGLFATEAGNWYSFDVWANDSVGNLNITSWNKTDMNGVITRREVNLNNTPEDIQYMPFYLWNTTYTAGAQEDRMVRDQGVGLVTSQVGFLDREIGDSVQWRSRGTGYAGGWFDDEGVCIEPFALNNIYFHIWWTTIEVNVPDLDTIGWGHSREDYIFAPIDSYGTSRDQNKSTIIYNGIAANRNKFFLDCNYIDTSVNYNFTDNNIYEFAIMAHNVSYGANTYATLLSNRSFNSFILFNVPDNTTLATNDTDGDTLNDFVELYVTYTNPFLADTDNDGINDYWENRSGSDPNNWTKAYNVTWAGWTHKPGYDNCTLGVPDFDEKQDDWVNFIAPNQWIYSGPIALLDCLWWLDCKYHNGTNGSFLPDLYGSGSHDPNNVMPLAEMIADNLSTQSAFAAGDMGGTSDENFTRGLYWLLDNFSVNDTTNVVIEGSAYGGGLQSCVNWTNMTNNISECHDVIVLIGFYCLDADIWSDRYGGHYLQINGYRIFENGSVAISVSDPWKDNAELGGWGWNSTHDHDLYGNGSHNWTQNVSYDWYWLNSSSTWDGGLCEATEIANYTNYTESMQWDLNNWFDDNAHNELPCTGEVRTIIEKSWYIWQETNITANQTIWNVSSSSWEEDLPLASVGTHQFNFTMENVGPMITNNVTVFTTHYDCLSYYIPGSAKIMYPNGTWSAFEPIRGWEAEVCDYAGHGHLTWCIEADNLAGFGLNSAIHILYNMSYNCTNYSKNTARIYICSDGSWCQSCISAYDNIFIATNCSLGKQFDHTIACSMNTSEASDWIISEHVKRDCVNCGECLDEDWEEAETEFDAWMPYNTSIGETGWRDWEWTYRYNSNVGTGNSLGLSYTIANNSCANRTQSTLRMKYNVTDWGGGDPDDPAIGTIYSFTNDSYYHMILYTWHGVYFLTKDGNSLYNTNDSTLVTGYASAYNYWEDYWSCNDTESLNELNPMEHGFGSGIWAKTEWNSYCGRLSTKAWNITQTRAFGLCFEPSGWIFDNYVKTYEQQVTKGVPDGTDALNYQIYKIIDVYQGTTHYVETTNEGPQDFDWSGNSIDWSPLGAEPATGTTYNVTYITWDNVSMFPNASCFGLVTWNPSHATGLKFYADFDFIEVWKLNYTYPPNDRMYYEDGQYHNHSMPKINYKAFTANRYTTYLNTWNTTCQWPYENGTLTNQQYADCTACFFKNISKLYNFESRFFHMERNCSNAYTYDNQNDSVYYYAGVITNLSEHATVEYNNALLLQIMDTTDGRNDFGDGAIVCIDVDNNSQWDDNDYAFVWWDAAGAGTRYFIWNGTEVLDYGYNISLPTDVRFMANYSDCPYDWLGIYVDGEEANAFLPSNHKYSNHRVYSLYIPMDLLIREDGEYLNTTDEFGLSIMSVNAGPDGVPLENNVVVWQDWNETACKNQYLNENGSNAWSYLLNLSNYTEIENFYTYGTGWNGISEDEIKYFGFGQIGNETGYLNQSYYTTTTEVTSNITHLINITDDQLVRYDITICNTGDTNLTNVTVSFSTLTTANIVDTNATSFYNYSSGGYSNYVFNVTNWINWTNCSMIYILVNFTANYVPNGSFIDTLFTSSATEPGSSSTDNYSFDYGENTYPVINWTYPANGASGVNLLLDNISCYVYDNDGDALTIYMYTNKSIIDNWNSVWNSIGTNVTDGFGHNLSNQTFNLSDDFNTRWRWGGTTYHWWINVTDGKAWVNESFYYTTGDSRYDVNLDHIVDVFDLNKDWSRRAALKSYVGVFDVNADSVVDVFDLNSIWSNRS